MKSYFEFSQGSCRAARSVGASSCSASTCFCERYRRCPAFFGAWKSACADDIGDSVSRLEHLAPLRPLFAKIEKFANLKLGLPKCVVIPTFGPATDARRAAFLHDLARIAPDWERFGVKSEAKYLGWRIGPRSAEEAWSDALKK